MGIQWWPKKRRRYLGCIQKSRRYSGAFSSRRILKQTSLSLACRKDKHCLLIWRICFTGFLWNRRTKTALFRLRPFAYSIFWLAEVATLVFHFRLANGPPILEQQRRKGCGLFSYEFFDLSLLWYMAPAFTWQHLTWFEWMVLSEWLRTGAHIIPFPSLKFRLGRAIWRIIKINYRTCRKKARTKGPNLLAANKCNRRGNRIESRLVYSVCVLEARTGSNSVPLTLNFCCPLELLFFCQRLRAQSCFAKA